MKSKYALSNWEMYKACWDRELLLVKRNLFLYGFRSFQTVLLAVFTAITFVKPRMPTQTQADGNKFIAVLFFSLMICMFDGITELNLTVCGVAMLHAANQHTLVPDSVSCAQHDCTPLLRILIAAL